HENVPSSSRFVQTQSPVRSQNNILSRVRRRLAKTKSAPAFGSSFIRSVTSACSPLKPFLMSHGSTATNTFNEPAKLSMTRGPGSVAPPAALAPVRRSAAALRPATPPPADLDPHPASPPSPPRTALL